MKYTPHTQEDINAMLLKIGAKDIDALFEACGAKAYESGGFDGETPQASDKVKKEISQATGKIQNGIPQTNSVIQNESFRLSQNGFSALETEKILKETAKKNKVYDAVFLGAGAYNHYIPPVVKHITSNPRFVTAYTPYQPEMSQGILQAIFEYQSCITRLTGLGVSNASMYDGAAAAAEAVLMSVDKAGAVLISDGVNPSVRRVVETYLRGSGRGIISVPLKKDGLTDADFIKKHLADAACCLIQQPNYFGNIEDAKTIGALLNGADVKYILHTYPVALPLLASPAECGADFATGEGQPLGLPLSFGGPYLGYIAAREKHIRKMTGRIVGETTDAEGRRVFVLTLQAREQHIRREKASSSICSNEALCALTAAVYLAAMGKKGFVSAAKICVKNARYLAEKLESAGLRLKYKDTEFFNEFVTVSDKTGSSEILGSLGKKGVLGGLKLNEKEILWCATEMNDRAQMDAVADIIKGLL
ncbi:MAG: aminomethyl-transferring glycine dehydrogenase subunit GcvPA [Clostridiales bacterium]|nr:aminomethyl-transferring glycine dehydrogenase subunit GcvPA [Clostridiales bacterium]